MGLLQFVSLLAIGAFHEAACGVASGASCNFLTITGGHKVSIRDVPYIVSINEIADDDADKYDVVCAGTIIDKRFILTAASCFDWEETKERTVLVSSTSATDKGIFIDVVKTICHEDYDSDTLANDICLVKLDSDVPFDWLIKAKLPEKDFDFVIGTSLNVTGWGADLHNAGSVGDLRQVTVPVLPQKCCDELYEDFTDSQICAGGRRRDYCEGDMGGPLTYNDIVVGIISGEGECGKNPGIYTRVHSYLDWIADTIMSNM